MDFEQIILSEIEEIDETYSSTYTSDHKVYRESEVIYYSTLLGLPNELISLIYEHYGHYLGSISSRNSQCTEWLTRFLQTEWAR
ncbi:MAG: hypothetical protein ACFFD3_12530, partial [Candidatus Thorarchaeota archaeon]